jgi:hypothetical protein
MSCFGIRSYSKTTTAMSNSNCFTRDSCTNSSNNRCIELHNATNGKRKTMPTLVLWSN